jgi:hypothetical protein
MYGDVGSGLTFRSPASGGKQQVRIAKKFPRRKQPLEAAMVLDGANGRKTVAVRNGGAFVVARLATVARCLPRRHGADVDMTVADDASHERLIKRTACSWAADWSQAAT